MVFCTIPLKFTLVDRSLSSYPGLILCLKNYANRQQNSHLLLRRVKNISVFIFWSMITCEKRSNPWLNLMFDLGLLRSIIFRLV